MAAPVDGKRILIVSIFYAPEETGIAPYTTGLAEHLAMLGHQVTVMTAMPSYPHWRVFPEYRGKLRDRELRGKVDVRRVRAYLPRGQSAPRRATYEASFLLAGLTALRLPRPDAILAVIPTLSSGVLARVAARRFACAYGLVFQDLTAPAATQSGVTGHGVAGLVSAVEGWATRDAAAVGIVAEGFRPYLESLGVDAQRIHRVRNWVHIRKPELGRTAIRRRLGLPQEAVICLHAGNMGLKQELTNIIECARLAARADPRLLFVLMGDGSQRSLLVARAQRYGLRNLRFLPVQPVGLFSSVLAAADVLLLNQRASVTSMSLPSKLTSYMASGRPVVAAIHSDSEAALELRAAMAGVICAPETPAAMLKALCDLADNSSLRERLGRSGAAWCREHLDAQRALPQWASLVERLTHRPYTRPTRLTSSRRQR